MHRQIDSDPSASFARERVDCGDVSAVEPGDPLGDGQAQSRATASFVGGPEALENPLTVLRSDALALI